MSRYILGIDQSTQGTKALVYDGAGRIAARCDRPHRQIINDKGWVEHDPLEIMDSVLKTAAGAIEKAKIDKKDIAGVGISNQRETALIWDKETGEPLYNAVVWQCARGADICRRIEEQGFSEKIKDATGLRLSPYFSAAKLAWIIENVPKARERAAAGKICCGTIDSWLVYCLTDGTSFKTDYSNASRTQLFNLRTLTWDEEICSLFGIFPDALPQVCFSDAVYGYTDFAGLLPEKIPINAVMGDSHAALFGQFCRRAGDVKSTYGTGSSIMMNVGEKPVFSGAGLVSSVAWGFNNKVEYVLEGNINYTGAVISWLKDSLKLISSPAETEELAENANPADKTYLVPAFSGLNAPYWDSEAAAVIVGMTRVTGRNEIVRAALDSIAYQITDIAELMQKESGLDIKALKTDGGPTKNSYLMQRQSDISGLEVEASTVEELSACGAAYMAGLALGIYSESELKEAIGYKKYSSAISEDARQKLRRGWKQAVKQALTHK